MRPARASSESESAVALARAALAAGGPAAAARGRRASSPPALAARLAPRPAASEGRVDGALGVGAAARSPGKFSAAGRRPPPPHSAARGAKPALPT